VYLVGFVTLSQQMGRSWLATLGAGRAVNFVPGLEDPVVSDRATATLTGPIGRRVQFNANMGAVRGRRATSEEDAAFVTYRGSTTLSVALSRRLNWTSGYARQDSDYGEVEFLVPQRLGAFQVAHTGLVIVLAKYLNFNITYANARVERRDADGYQARFRRQSLMAAISTSLPLYATVRK
jgi:hypothetical protein